MHLLTNKTSIIVGISKKRPTILFKQNSQYVWLFGHYYFNLYSNCVLSYSTFDLADETDDPIL